MDLEDGELHDSDPNEAQACSSQSSLLTSGTDTKEKEMEIDILVEAWNSLANQMPTPSASSVMLIPLPSPTANSQPLSSKQITQQISPNARRVSPDTADVESVLDNMVDAVSRNYKTSGDGQKIDDGDEQINALRLAVLKSLKRGEREDGEVCDDDDQTKEHNQKSERKRKEKMERERDRRSPDRERDRLSKRISSRSTNARTSRDRDRAHKERERNSGAYRDRNRWSKSPRRRSPHCRRREPLSYLCDYSRTKDLPRSSVSVEDISFKLIGKSNSSNSLSLHKEKEKPGPGSLNSHDRKSGEALISVVLGESNSVAKGEGRQQQNSHCSSLNVNDADSMPPPSSPSPTPAELFASDSSVPTIPLSVIEVGDVPLPKDPPPPTATTSVVQMDLSGNIISRCKNDNYDNILMDMSSCSSPVANSGKSVVQSPTYPPRPDSPIVDSTNRVPRKRPRLDSDSIDEERMRLMLLAQIKTPVNSKDDSSKRLPTVSVSDATVKSKASEIAIVHNSDSRLSKRRKKAAARQSLASNLELAPVSSRSNAAIYSGSGSSGRRLSSTMNSWGSSCFIQSSPSTSSTSVTEMQFQDQRALLRRLNHVVDTRLSEILELHEQRKKLLKSLTDITDQIHKAKNEYSEALGERDKLRPRIEAEEKRRLSDVMKFDPFASAIYSCRPDIDAGENELDQGQDVSGSENPSVTANENRSMTTVVTASISDIDSTLNEEELRQQLLKTLATARNVPVEHLISTSTREVASAAKFIENRSGTPPAPRCDVENCATSPECGGDLHVTIERDSSLNSDPNGIYLVMNSPGDSISNHEVALEDDDIRIETDQSTGNSDGVALGVSGDIMRKSDDPYKSKEIPLRLRMFAGEQRRIDPIQPICPYETMGVCKDYSCEFQHLKDHELPLRDVLLMVIQFAPHLAGEKLKKSDLRGKLDEMVTWQRADENRDDFLRRLLRRLPKNWQVTGKSSGSVEDKTGNFESYYGQLCIGSG